MVESFETLDQHNITYPICYDRGINNGTLIVFVMSIFTIAVLLQF